MTISSQTPLSHRLRTQNDLLLWEHEIDQILGGLSLDQKVAQLHQIPLLDGRAEALIREGKVGSALFAANAFAGNERDEGSSWRTAEHFQRLATDQNRIPLLFARDVIHGHHTVFPIPLGQAAAWNPELVQKAQSVAAREATADGLHWTFSPVADIGRDPRWGRVAEGYGEDPHLTAELAVAAVRGFQDGEHPILACLKHYAAYGAAEGGRDYARVSVGPHEMREVYLPPFRRGVEAGAASVMAAFHEVDGIPSTANRHLLREILKEEWDFHGVVVSDWNAIEELVCHGVAADRRHAARLAIEAGIDVDMVSGCYHEHLASLVRDGLVAERLVDDATRRVLRLKFASRLFDAPLRRDVLPVAGPVPAHLALSRSFAAESCVLLKNENQILPLKKSQPLYLVGPFVSAREELQGTWTCDGKAEWITSMLEAMSRTSEGALTSHQFHDTLVASARTARCVLALLGEHPSRSGEAHSVADIGLPPGQIELLRALSLAEVPIITVVFTGRALALAEVSRLSTALLIAWHPGTAGALGITDVLYGDAEPSGRLPVSLPFHGGQIPVHYSHTTTGRPQQAPDSRYLDAPAGAQYTFGYGLSYVRCVCEDLHIVTMGENRWNIRLVVRNIGKVATSATVQLYIRDLVASRARPVRLLKAFRKVTLAPLELREVSLELNAHDLAFSRADGSWGAEPGEFRIWVELNSREGLEASITLV